MLQALMPRPDSVQQRLSARWVGVGAGGVSWLLVRLLARLRLESAAGLVDLLHSV